MISRWLTRYPIVRKGKLFLLTDGRHVFSFHRSISGALRARRFLIEQAQQQQKV
jgi:hypothetical protein